MRWQKEKFSWRWTLEEFKTQIKFLKKGISSAGKRGYLCQTEEEICIFARGSIYDPARERDGGGRVSRSISYIAHISCNFDKVLRKERRHKYAGGAVS